MPETIKSGAYVVSLDKFGDSGTHWIALYVKNNEVIYFDSFGADYVPDALMHFIKNSNNKTNIFRIQADNSIMCRYFCIAFIYFRLAVKNLIDFPSLISPHDFKRNDDIILSYFK